MSNTTYISLINKLKGFANAHFQIKRIGFDFDEQSEDFYVKSDEFPAVFVSLNSIDTDVNINTITVTIECLDRIAEDRKNINYVTSDCSLILNDIYLWLADGDDVSFSVTTPPQSTPLNNVKLDYCAGAEMSISIEVDNYTVCAIPMGEIPEPTPNCEDATYELTIDGLTVDSGSIPSGENAVIPIDEFINTCTDALLDEDGNFILDEDGNCISGEGCAYVNYVVKYEDETPIESGSVESGGSIEVIVPNCPTPEPCEDATAELYFDDALIDTLTIPSGDTDSFSIDCATQINAVRVDASEIGHQHGGTFKLSGTLNGKDTYVKVDDTDKIIYYDGTRWILEKLGGGAHTHEAALGNEDYPWEADWTLENLTMQQATVGTYCSNGNICADATVENTDQSYQTTVESGGTLVLPDTTINVTDQDNNILDTITFPVYSTVNIDIDSYCEDATVENSDASYTDIVASGGTLVLPDSDVNVNGNLEGTVVSVKDIDIDVTDGTNPVTPDAITISGNTITIEVPAGGGAPVGATLIRTGQTTSYRTGDDANTNSEGRATDFFTLASNNPFGNTDRFTDELGGQTYTNNIVIDWSTYDGTTVLGYRRTTNGGNITWNSAIDGALLVSIGSFTSGWRLPNVNEMQNLVNYEFLNSGRVFDYSPINLNASNIFWTSTTQTISSTLAFAITNANGTIQAANKTNNTSYRYIPCRTFTVTGTTLT